MRIFGDIDIVDDKEIMHELDISESTLRRLVQTDQLPQPRRLGNKKYWLRDELKKYFIERKI